MTLDLSKPVMRTKLILNIPDYYLNVDGYLLCESIYCYFILYRDDLNKQVYTEHAGLKISVNLCIASAFSRQMANRNAGPAAALESMRVKQYFRCRSLILVLCTNSKREKVIFWPICPHHDFYFPLRSTVHKEGPKKNRSAMAESAVFSRPAYSL